MIQSEFGISVDHQLFWIMEAEDDGQKRPQRAIPPVDEEFRMFFYIIYHFLVIIIIIFIYIL